LNSTTPDPAGIKRIKLKAAIDWIRFELTLPDGSVIKRDCHDIHGPRDLDQRLEELAARYEYLSIRPIAAELAIDGYHETDDLNALADFTARTWRMNTANIADRQRLYRTRVERVTAVPAHDALAFAFRNGWQAGEGNIQDSVMRHAYVKMTDDAARQNVRPRSRLEIRLQGDACPFRTIDELRGFDWLSLAPYFRFRKLKGDIDGFAALIADRSTTVGKRTPRTIAGKGKRLHSDLTKADSDLNRRYRDALRVLARRWKRAVEPTATHPDVAQKIGNSCGNCGQNSTATRAVAGNPLITTCLLPTTNKEEPQQDQAKRKDSSKPEQPASPTQNREAVKHRARSAHERSEFAFASASERAGEARTRARKHPSPAARGFRICLEQSSSDERSDSHASAQTPNYCKSIQKSTSLRKTTPARMHPARSAPRPNPALIRPQPHV
jgi:hypothetical protein